MAASMILYAVVEEFFIEDEIQHLLMQNHRLVTISCVLATLRQAHVPRITGFAENVVPAFTPLDAISESVSRYSRIFYIYLGLHYYQSMVGERITLIL